VTHPGRWRPLLVLLAVLPLLRCTAVVASTPPAPDAGPAAPAALSRLPTLRVGFPERYAASAPLWVAVAADLVRRHDLAVSLVPVAEQAGLTTLTAGEIDVFLGSGTLALTAAAEGHELRLVAGLVNTFPQRLLVASSIHTPADLRGGRVAVGRPGALSDLAVRFALRELRLEPGKDVVLLQIGAASERLAALENGAVQAAAVVPPESVLLERLGLNPLFDLWGAGVDAATHQVLVSARLTREEPALVQGLVDALIEGIARAKRDRGLTKRVLAEYLQVTDDAALEEAYELFVQQLLPRAPYPTVEGLRRLVPLLAETDSRVAAIETAALVERGFVQQAVDRGLLARLYGGQ
jgi:NitT/TauT family transport system substrate-binding protein